VRVGFLHVGVSMMAAVAAVCSLSAGPQTTTRRATPAAATAAAGSPAGAAAGAAASAAAGAVTIEQITDYPFPSELIAAPVGQRFAWTAFQHGVRRIWIADGPAFQARELVTYPHDDGQELTGFAFSGDGKYLVYARGGDHGSNWAAERNLMPNPASSPVQPKLQVWSVAADSGAPVLLGDGDAPAPSPHGDRVAFERDGEIWSAPVDGGKPASKLFFARGHSQSPVWSPDGKTLAFVSDRESHAFIGLYVSDDQPIRYLAPSSSQDDSLRWSPDGTRIAFVRHPGRGGPAVPPLTSRTNPWAIWVVDAKSGDGDAIWQSTDTPRGSFPYVAGEANLTWGAGDRLVFSSYQDGWPHLYSVSARVTRPAGAAATGAANTALLLTPGNFMVEDVSIAPDRRSIVYNANTGPDKDDGERRHLFRVPVDAATPTPLTSGPGLEWAPTVSADGRSLAYFASGAQVPPAAFVRTLDAAPPRAMVAGQPAADFPSAKLVTPRHVTFTAADGVTVHGQLFGAADAPAAGAARRPAVLFVHGGPPRQMLLGWHYMMYYANAYAMNQYLASRGFIVLSVNYRLGIGYGYDFHVPANGGARGASEYQDVLAAGKYLQQRADVDPARVGIWGGSYGGFLTALALGRNSEVFAAGVDLHGVHSREFSPSAALESAAAVGDGVTRAQLDDAVRVAWQSSPVAYVKTWKSPVLLIHGDDDRNVRVEQTVDLVQRLKAQGVSYEEMILPDEIHDFLSYRNWQRVDRATAEYLERKLKPATPATAAATGAAASR
jgi:dipeptidyl aminopeptidase/acylaminoacyl peptidase